MAAELNNSYAFFNLGYLYSNDDFFDIDKSIYYYSKCKEIHYDNIKIYNNMDDSTSIHIRYNKYFYRSFNDLGLIYITYFNDIIKANEYIKVAGLNEFPYGQNNFGLLCQFYLNNISLAEYMFEKSSKHNFALAEYNLGHLKEEKGKNKESIEYFKKASEHEDEILLFHNHKHYDKRLEISKSFIICLTNLKLVDYYIKLNNYSEAKKFFVKSLDKIIANTKNSSNNYIVFKYNNNDENCFSFLKSLILRCPLFNLENKQTKMEINNKNNMKNLNKPKINISNQSVNMYKDQNEYCFKNTRNFFDFIIQNELFTKKFIEEIKKIIKTMEKIIYNPPYSILFGRINLSKIKQKSEENKIISVRNIDQSFYEGFGL